MAFGKGKNSTVLVATETKLYRSTNSGTSWVPSSNTFNLLYPDVLATDTNWNIFLADGQDILKSTDDGVNWTSIGSSLSGNSFSGITINTHDIIFTGTYGGGVYRSADHGATWQQVKNGLPTEPGVGDLYPIDALASAPNGSVFALTSGGVARSTNDGDSWEVVGGSAVPATIWNLAASGSGKLFLSTLSGLLTSNDNGNSWTSLVNKNGLNTIYSLHVTTDGGQIILLSARQGLWMSVDDGATWKQTRASYPGDQDLTVYMDSNAAHIFDGTNNSGVSYSSDKGGSWASRNGGLVKTEIHSMAAAGGGKFIVQAKDEIHGNAIYKTSDAGDTWDTLITGYNFTSVAASDDTIFAASNGAGLYKSSDGGATWQKDNTLPGIYKENLNVVIVTGEGVAYIGADNGALYRANNKGAWTIKSSGLPTSPIKLLTANNPGDIFTVNADGGVFRTTNNGTAWSPLATAPSGIAAIAADSAGTIYAGTGSGLFRSLNNGDTWEQATGITNVSGIAVHSSGKVYAIGNGGTYSSEDKGASWQFVNGALNAVGPTVLTFDRVQRLFAGTTGAGVFRASATTTGSVSLQHIIAGICTIEDNYPNPFFTATNIPFTLSESGLVKIEVLDLNGKLVTVPDEQFMEKGMQSFAFDAHALKLKSGVYCCRISCKGISVVKNVIFLGK